MVVWTEVLYHLMHVCSSIYRLHRPLLLFHSRLRTSDSDSQAPRCWRRRWRFDFVIGLCLVHIRQPHLHPLWHLLLCPRHARRPRIGPRNSDPIERILRPRRICSGRQRQPHHRRARPRSRRQLPADTPRTPAPTRTAATHAPDPTHRPTQPPSRPPFLELGPHTHVRPTPASVILRPTSTPSACMRARASGEHVLSSRQHPKAVSKRRDGRLRGFTIRVGRSL